MYDSTYAGTNTTKNSKKRVRASQACVYCRKKKIRCDENRPSCTQCIEANVICEYSEPKKRGPRKGYVQLLEERLVQMERKLMGSSPTDSKPTQPYSPIQINKRLEGLDLPPIDIINQIVDLFFKHINSVFPFIHRSELKKSIQDGSVSRPLLYSVLAIGARFSENPSIRTNPPYLAGEKYAEKALSLVDFNTLQPTLENIQFWGIMSCFEYARASGSRAWIYGGLAIRFCQELELYKEETQSVPIFADDGTIDTIAMAVRRRVFWSCFSIDKLSNAGTHRPQSIEKSDCDVNMPNITECLIVRDPVFHCNSNGKNIAEDSLMTIHKYYLKIIGSFGEVNKYMYRAKSNSASVVWPPIPEFRNLDTQLLEWKNSLPESFQFNQNNLDYHRQHASLNYLNTWLCSHAIWCSSMMILHRGSLAFSDLKYTDSLAEDLYRRIQSSIEACKMSVDAAMGIFEAIKKYSGNNTLPYMGYSAYVFSTLLMTSTFNGSPEKIKKSSRCLKTLSELIDGLGPYWQICERLSNATKELLSVHEKMYQQDLNSYMPFTNIENRTSSILSRSPSSHSSSSFTLSPIQINTSHSTPPLSTLLGTATTTTATTTTAAEAAAAESPIPSFQQQQQQQSELYKNTPNSSYLLSANNQQIRNNNNEIDFNSLEFLYDTGLFGQVVFDVNNYSQQQQFFSNNNNSMISSFEESPTNSSTINEQQSPTASYHPIRSLWS